MEENKHEILKRKRIRKLLLLKINDELKVITKTKSNIRINSKTIQELNKLYNKNDILLYEKSTIYTNYIKTEETVISNISSINISKTLNELVVQPNTNSKGRNKIKNKNKSIEENKMQFEFNSLEEDSSSPIKSFFPKKIELGRKKFLETKPKPRHHESVLKISKKNVNLSKEVNENKLNKSTKLGNGDLHLYELIEKITSIKQNENKEGVIRENIKKLRNYCYQLRKKRKKIKVNTNKNNSSRKKSKFREKKIERSLEKKRSTILNKDVVEKSLFLIKQKIEDRKFNKINKRNDTTSPSPSPRFNFNIRKKSTAKVIKLNLNNNKHKINIIPPNKNLKNSSTLKNKEKLKKLQSVSEFADNKYINKFGSKRKKKKSLNNENKMIVEENTPALHLISKNLMRSTINEIRMKIDNANNDEGDKNKLKYNKLKFHHKKILNKNVNLNLNMTTNNIENENNKFKYFNSINIKKDKVELHDNLNRSSKKFKNYEQKKENSKKNEENNEEIIKLKKLSIVLDSRKKSKKKLIESPDRRVYRYSNFTNYNTTVTNDRTNKSFAKKNKRSKE